MSQTLRAHALGLAEIVFGRGSILEQPDFVMNQPRSWSGRRDSGATDLTGWAAAAQGAGPAAPDSYLGELDRYAAGTAVLVGPAVPENLDPVRSKRVVPANVLPPLLRRVVGLAVDFDPHAKFLVEVVEVLSRTAAHSSASRRSRPVNAA